MNTHGVDFATGGMRLPLDGREPAVRVARFNGFTKDYALPRHSLELPGRHIGLMISFGEPLALFDDAAIYARTANSFVAGLQMSSTIIGRHGRHQGIHVKLTPMAAHALLGVPMVELSGRLVELHAVLGKGTDELVEKLAALWTWPERFAVLRRFLADRMVAGPRPSAAVSWAWHRLRSTNGKVRVEDLVKESGVSHRHLIARFRDEVGVSPKALARVLRFERALGLLRHSPASLGAVAAAAGYYDQAHLNRDFRELAGRPPGVLLRRPRSDSSKTV